MNEKYMYSNSVTCSFSFHDFSMVFSYINGKSEEIDSIAINMSPQHAKSFLAVLNYSIEEYEKQFGKINTREIKAQLTEVAATRDKDISN